MEIKTQEKLELKKEFNLKAYAVLSVRKEVPKEWLVKNMNILVIAFGFSDADVIMTCEKIIQEKGLKRDDYHTPFLMISRDLGEVLDMVPMGEGENGPGALDIVIPKEEIMAPSSNPALKSAVILETSVRYMFGEVATKEEKKVMEAVIKKFIQWAEYKGREKSK